MPSPDGAVRLRLRPPLFEMGLKGYLYGEAAVRLAVEADRVCEETGVGIIFDPQAVDIAAVARATSRIHVFAQHMDPVEVGRGTGAVLAEALREAGAVGTLLNHAERRLTLADIDRTLRRAREVGLATVACCDSPEEAAALAHLGPDVVLAEPPELIGTGESVGRRMRGFVERTIELVGAVDADIVVACGAGVRTPEDVAEMVALGVGATGSTSGILRAPDPAAQLRAMVRAMAEAWARHHPSVAGPAAG
ncbi:MAG TPA: triose-phosphate isomerase [Candidatus Limnocylindrales bacterium]